VTVRQHVILVGERDEVLRTIIASKLQEEGYAVLTTADGPSLADSVQEAAISLLLLDSSFLQRQYQRRNQDSLIRKSKFLQQGISLLMSSATT
jgi:DNA-binding response OmpR family regulator